MNEKEAKEYAFSLLCELAEEYLQIGSCPACELHIFNHLPGCSFESFLEWYQNREKETDENFH